MYFIGLDTSCYTTSAALMDENLQLIYDGRIVLKVEKGSRGLRQSEAVFQHHNNLSKLITELFKMADSSKIACITVSSKPRDMENSYMPVFSAGINTARIISSCLGIEIVEASHQQGHIAAGIWSSQANLSEKFLVYHVSGGTTELLLADNTNKLTASIIGGSKDLNAGQFVDRVGVALGLEFPCGQKMDSLCNDKKIEPINMPVSVNNKHISFSGPESHAQRLINKQKNIDDSFIAAVAQGVFLSIAKSIEKTIVNAALENKINEVLMVGGVMSNSIIKEYLLNSKKLNTNGISLYFALPKFSTDNAVGTALIGISEKANKSRRS